MLLDSRFISEGGISCSLGGAFKIVLGPTHLEMASGEILEPLERIKDKEVAGHLAYGFRYLGGWRVSHTLHQDKDLIRIETTLSQEKPCQSRIKRLVIAHDTCIETEKDLNRTFWHTEAMDGFAGVEASPEQFQSWGLAGLTSEQGDLALVAGFEDFHSYSCGIHGSRETNRTHFLEGVCSLEDRELSSADSVTIPPLVFAVGESLALLLDEHAVRVAERMRVRPLPASPVGWCSWYCYYGRENEEDIRANLKALADSPLRRENAVFQIDDGWNLPVPGHARVWGDWFPGKKFPQGMASITGEIRAHGFVPGLWLAPFSVDAASCLAREHPEWLVQKIGEDGHVAGPQDAPGSPDVYALDLSRPEVLDFIRTTFRRVFSEWKFDYIKIDFLRHALTPGRRWNAGQTAIEAFRAGLQVIREEAGPDRFVLLCGCPFGPAIGLGEAMRVGLDVGGGWDPPYRLKSWPDGNCCVRAAARPAFYRHWMHRRWWINDPDCLIVRDQPVRAEVEELGKVATDPLLIPPTHFLTDNEADCWAQFLWMIGGAVILSEIWADVPESRRRLAEKVLEPNPQSVRWVDWYAHPDLCLFRTIEHPLLVGIFNFSDESLDVDLPAEKFQLSHWKFVARGSDETFSGKGEIIRFPKIAPRSGRIWKLEPL